MSTAECQCLGHLNMEHEWVIDVYVTSCSRHADLIRYNEELKIPVGVSIRDTQRGERIKIGSFEYVAGEDLRAGEIVGIDPISGRIIKC